MAACTTICVPELSTRYRALLAWRKTPPPGTAAVHFVDTIRTVFQRASPPP